MEKNFFYIGMEPSHVEGMSLARLCGFLTPWVPDYQQLKGACHNLGHNPEQ